MSTAVARQPSTPGRTTIRAVHRALWIAGWPVRTLLLGLIAAYRATLSGVLGGQCRFEPSCSAYAAQAIRARGAFVGSGLALWRVARCNPFGRGGADPAPGQPTYDGVTQERPA
jgi:putative membrane protein insertion efficiency factor